MTTCLVENKEQKIDETFSCWKDKEYDVRQGSILGPLLFNIHVYFFTPLKI